MKIGIISEPHLGRARFRKTVNDINLIEQEGYDHWHRSIEALIEKEPDIVFISGDLYDQPNPTSLSTSHAIRGLNTLRESGTAVYVVAGNHEFSNKNFKNDIHPYRVLEAIYPEFNFQYKDEAIIHLSDYVIALLPHQPVKFDDNLKVSNSLSSNYARIMSAVNKTDKKRILVTHGTIESWAKVYSYKGEISESTKVSNMVLSDSFVENFDITIIGHNHQHFTEKIDSKTRGDVFRISPGSLLDERSSKDNGPTLIEVEDGKVKNIDYISIPSINTYKMTASNATELIEVLQSIEKNHIYLITYYGKWADLDSSLYEESLSKALYLNIIESSEKEQQKQRLKLKDFWTWVKDMSPEIHDEFKSIIENKDKKGVS